MIVVAILALSRSTRASERALRRSVLSTARSAANTAAAMGDLRGALVDFADLEDTVVVVDIASLYQLLQFRQALCAIYFTRAGLRPGAPAGIGRVRAGAFTINFSFPGKMLIVIG